MSKNNSSRGRTGISGSASVEVERIDTGSTAPLVSDSDELLLAKMVGEDGDGDFQRIATDSEGRVKVKDVQFDGTVDIGDLQVLNTSDQKIDPATEGTLSNIETNTSGLATESTLEAANTNLSGIDSQLSIIENNTSGLATETTLETTNSNLSGIDSQLSIIENNTSGLATESTLETTNSNLSGIDNELANIEANTSGLATESTLSTIEGNTSSLATESTLSAIEVNTDGLFEASDFTETRTIEQNNAGLFEASDFTEARNVRELQNETGVVSGQDTGGGTLPSNSVPDGKAVSIKAQFGNTGAVQINGDYPLLEGDSVSLQVQNTDQISYTTANGTEGVAFIVEG